ncbi:MAG: glucose-6-phosphate dehydrogenase [Candidatus Paceibacteria bacterium]
MRVNEPTVIIILGATGDLSRRKLLPALFHLYNRNLLPEKFAVVGFSRKDLSNEDFRKIAKEAVTNKDNSHSEEILNKFLENISYTQGIFDEKEGYKALNESLSDIDNKWGTCSNKLFHLAVPPSLYDDIFEHLAKSGLTIPCGADKGWTRVLVEKPFGKDLKTARELDVKLGKLFDERQIFRIDHYMAKEALQDVLSFRFSNSLFEPLWNKDHIEKIEVKFFETLGMEGRGTFYDGIGALRDVGQNHMLQMLAFATMENPGKLDADAIRKNRAELLGALAPMNKVQIKEDTKRGQYDGYKDESEVESNSKTETYFKIKAYIDNDRWEGMPFYLESGKKMNESKKEISIYFKKPTTCICPTEEEHKEHQNVLSFRIDPDEGISIRFWAKKSGFDMSLEPKELSFMYNDKKENGEKIPDAYERVLFDSIKGDQTLFASTEELEASWKFITPIFEGWKDIELKEYEDGSASENIINS